jgi:hypothetical protein
MDQEAGRTIDPDALEAGRAYRVDHKNERLRRSFRFTGTFLGREERSADGETAWFLLFEIKPRFGKPARQPVELSTILAIEPA